ncbi:MAG: hypothetical protein STSR0004_19800 [Peptococcaceae bacterium]
MKAKDNLDILLEQIINERIARAPKPNLERIWARIAGKIKQKNRARKIRLAFATLTILVLCFGFFSLLYPAPVKGTGKIMWHFFLGTKEKTGTVLVGPAKQDASPEQIPLVDLKRIKTKCPFPVLVPGYVPSGFKLTLARYTPSGGGGEVQFYYEAKEKFFIFTQWSDISWGTMYINKPKEIVIRMPVIIRGKPAQLIHDEKKKQAALTWAEGKINYHLGGTISPQEILRTARSLQ